MSTSNDSIRESVAVVTGGTKGIGFGIAEALIEAGARVFICGRDKGDLKAAIDRLSQKGEAAGEICDVRSEDQVRLMIEECDRVFGGVDILVNNTSVGYFGKTEECTSGDEVRQTRETHMIGVYYGVHY